MRDNSDNTPNAEKIPGAFAARRTRLNKRLAHRKRRIIKAREDAVHEHGSLAPFDPEMLYVECEKCGSPVIWGEGRAAHILAEAGIDPLELDSFCILLTDGCPVCGLRNEYSVRILRSSIRPGLMPAHGHA